MEFRKMVMITLYAKHTALIKITKGLSFLGAARGHQTSSHPHSAVQPAAFFIRLWGWPLCCLLLSFSSFWHQPPKDASLSIHPHPVFLALLHLSSDGKEGLLCGKFCVSTISSLSLLPLLPQSCPDWCPCSFLTSRWLSSTQSQNQPTIHLESGLGHINSLLGVLQCSHHLQPLADADCGWGL